MNATTHNQDPLGRAPPVIAVEMFVAIVITITSLLGNILVIYVVHKDPRMRSITNVFIESLAWSDIGMATLKMPFWILSNNKGQWVLSNAFCPWSAVLMFTFGICSIMTMALIAVNRYFKVVKNNLYAKYFRSRRAAVWYCIALWVVAILLSTPPLYGWGAMRYHAFFSVCTMVWDLENISYVIVVVGGAVGGSTVAIFICYYKIYKTVKSATANLNNHQTNSSIPHTTDVKLLKSTFAVVCFYLATWMPVSFVVVLETIGLSVPRLVFVFVVYMMFTSSLGNPIIYGILNPQFRKAFSCAVKCRSFSQVHGITISSLAGSCAT